MSGMWTVLKLGGLFRRSAETRDFHRRYTLVAGEVCIATGPWNVSWMVTSGKFIAMDLNARLRLLEYKQTRFGPLMFHRYYGLREPTTGDWEESSNLLSVSDHTD
jgi:hypothetical protein